MTRVSEMARITAAGIDPRDPDSIAARSYLVWNAARNQTNRIKRVDGPRGGLLFHGNLTSVILDLWPNLSHSDKHDELDRFRKEVYGFLRATSNAVNEKRGTNGGDVVWWIADPWIAPVGPVVLKVSAGQAAPLQPTNTERRLTPKEAGEDRDPQPVSVTTVTTTTITTETEDTHMTAAAAVQAPSGGVETQVSRHQEILTCIEDTVRKASPQPLTASEISADLGLHVSSTRTGLAELIELGQVYSRVETAEERQVRYGAGSIPSVRAALYSISNPVPRRTKREVVRGHLAVAATRTPSPRHANDAAILRVMGTRRWERASAIIARARIPKGSATSVLVRLVEKGLIEMDEMRRQGDQTVRVYRKVATKRTEVPPVVDTQPAPVPPTSTDARERAVQAVEALLDSVASANVPDPEIARLEGELAQANARVAELEKALAPLQALLGRGV